MQGNAALLDPSVQHPDVRNRRRITFQQVKQD
jgi:hypothetical protein